MVTGTIGDAALGLDVLKDGAVAAALANDAVATAMLAGRYRIPQPRNALAAAIRDHAAAAMDMSDGLAGDLTKLCAASAYRRRSMPKAFRCPPRQRHCSQQGTVGIDAIVAGGDDYEILCAIPENRFASVREGGEQRPMCR